MNLKETALKYEPPKTMNIADLNKIPADVEVLDGEGTDSNKKKFYYKYIEVDNVEYRVPGVVLGDMKFILEKYPETTHFLVSKKGEGLKTRYHVMQAI